MNKIISQSRFFFSIFGPKTYISIYAAMKDSSVHLSIPLWAQKLKHLTHNLQNINRHNSTTESLYLPNQWQFHPMFTWVSLLMLAVETKLLRQVELCFHLKTLILKQPSTPVKLSTMVSLKWPEDNSRWNIIDKIATIELTVSHMMSLMSSQWLQIAHSNPKTSSPPV